MRYVEELVVAPNYYLFLMDVIPTSIPMSQSAISVDDVSSDSPRAQVSKERA